LLRIAEAHEARSEKLARTIALETGNALRTQARSEARLSADIFRYFGGLASELKGETIPLGEHVLSYTRREPLGVVGAIIPWNAPLLLDALKIAPALCAVAREEIFGPVLVAIPWRDEAEAIRMANDSHYGLAAYVWTHDIGSALRTAHAIESGWVQVNQGLGQQPGHSYGGYKQSGIGREFSLEGMLDSFTQRKNVTVNLSTPRRGA
jgi:acyl-CoA reductase-like NAD-dependent aldehyde dehydrogenase